MSSGQEVGSIFSADALLRSPTVLVATIALWGLNVHLFRTFGIDYVHVIMETKDDEGALPAEDDADGAVTPNKSIHGVIEMTTTEKAEGRGRGGGGEIEKSGASPSPPSTPHEDVRYRPASGASSRSETSAPAPPALASAAVLYSSLAQSSASPPPSVPVGGRFFLRLAAFLAILLMAVEYVWMHVLDGSSLGAILLFYGAAASFVIQNEDVRHCLSVVSRRAAVLLWPRCRSAAPVHVAFVDVFFADAMCSLSKVFFDWGMIWTIAYYHPNPVPQSYGSVVFPSLGASLPYIIRARQCILCWAEGKMNNDPNRYLHLLNCLKYSTSLFPLCISAYQKTMGGTVDDQYRVERILVIFLAINAGYSFAWDVVMDWGMAQNPSCSCKGNASGEHISTIESFLRPRLRFGVYASFSILILDGILRGSWMLRFYENALFSSVDVYVFTTQFLEVFRRGIWNLLRVDWEMVKQIQKRKGKEKDMPNPKPLDPGDSDTVPLVLI